MFEECSAVPLQWPASKLSSDDIILFPHIRMELQRKENDGWTNDEVQVSLLWG